MTNPEELIRADRDAMEDKFTEEVCETITLHDMRPMLSAITILPEDTIVVSAEKRLQQIEIATITDTIKTLFKCRRVLVLDDGITIGVIHNPRDE